jgi:4'-phosphopantetheinyl transferase
VPGRGPTPRVDVWFGSLEASEAELARLGRILSEDELERARRFRFSRDRDRYVAGRGLLRVLLGGYTGSPPEALEFAYSAYGKPRLAAVERLSFNVSHSADQIVVAVAPGVPIGVDIEVPDSKPSDELVARRFFSAAEVRDLLALPTDVRPRAFLACWTRKEAYIKARGEGLSLPLQEFDVTLAPGVAPQLRRTAWSETEPSEWLLLDISDHCPGCVAALALRAHAADLRFGPLASGVAGAGPGPSPTLEARTEVPAEA